ncbi:MAG: bifunctional DNA primase/polymerase [Gemmatimonadaceae bacterium]
MQTHKPLSPMGAAALALAQCGFAVFPCTPRGKEPITDDGFHSATTDEARIREWWAVHPSANIGLYPGASQLIVLDVDGPAGEALARELGALDEETLSAETSRGRHYYYRLPAGVTVRNVHRTELDVRAHAGYVLAPASVHPSGFIYRWRGELEVIADIPEQLLTALLPPTAPQNPLRNFPRAERIGFDSLTECRVLRYAAKIGYGIGEGGRNNAAYSFARFLARDLGLSENEAGSFLSTWNSYNSPPLSERELASVHRSARNAHATRGAV